MDALLGLTLFGSGILFALFALLFLLALITADLSEMGTHATIAAIIFFGLAYFWGSPEIFDIFTIRNALLYVFIGFLFSLLRTYFKGKELSAENKKYFHLKDHVFRWWFLWPICAINWIFGRLLGDLFDFLYTKLNKVYTSIFNA